MATMGIIARHKMAAMRAGASHQILEDSKGRRASSYDKDCCFIMGALEELFSNKGNTL